MCGLPDFFLLFQVPFAYLGLLLNFSHLKLPKCFRLDWIMCCVICIQMHLGYGVTNLTQLQVPRKIDRLSQGFKGRSPHAQASTLIAGFGLIGCCESTNIMHVDARWLNKQGKL